MGEIMEQTVFSVSDINREVKMFLEGTNTFKNIFIEGELSNITYYRSGHLYFTLKDASASVKCAIFRYKYRGVPEDLKEGDLVKIRGSVTLYEANGSYQIVADFLEKSNSLGLLYEKMEMLKKLYFEKGYFFDEIKKRLPKLPINIGVVTADTGAAIRDIINTTHKRFPNVNIYLYPAKVQGEGAAREVSEGIEFFNRMNEEQQLEIDTLIVGRGGGSIEDLWAFNEEAVIEAIYKSEIPVISAVGHEIDNLLSDLVADKRAATPTQAAEILIPEKDKLTDELESKKNLLSKLLLNKVTMMKKELEYRKNNYYIKNFANILDNKKFELMEKEQKLSRELRRIVQKSREQLDYRKQRFDRINLQKIILSEKENLKKKSAELNQIILEFFENRKKELKYKKAQLSKYSVSDILKQGYTITRKNGKIVKRGIELSKEDKLEIEFSDVKKKVVVK